MKKRLRRVIKNAKGPVYIIADGLKYPANKKAIRVMRAERLPSAVVTRAALDVLYKSIVVRRPTQ